MSPEPTILYVEDHPDTREAISLLLDELGYEIRTCCTAGEGLELARTRHFDLFILDNWLPDMSGIELCREIRRFDPITPVLFFTALVHLGREALSAGAQVYLIKPANRQDLARTVAHLLGCSNNQALRREQAKAQTVGNG
jgi:DNA-binding response OmpR family regulator